MRSKGLYLAAGAAAMAAAWGCVPQPPASPPAAQALDCRALPGVEALLAPTSARIVVLGGTGPAGLEAFAETLCHAAARQERVIAAWSGPPAPGLGARILAWTQAGAQVRVVELPEAADGDEADRARALMALAGGQDRVVAHVPPESAARRPIGLSGETRTPLGAHLPADAATGLLVVQSGEGNGGVVLGPFEDIPRAGAALVYDGVIEIGGSADALGEPAEGLRGRD